MNSNYVALRKNHLELTEYKCMLKSADTFLSETRNATIIGFNSNNVILFIGLRVDLDFEPYFCLDTVFFFNADPDPHTARD